KTHDHATFHPQPSQRETDGLAAALTEQRNPRSQNLEKMTAHELVQLFVEEEKFVQDALRTATADLARAIETVTESLRNGGRLFYVGAGSSGRIGVLDASEIPPTFGAPRHLVQGVIAGGAMLGLGKVRGNLMIALHPPSTKLRDRAVRIVCEVTQRDYESARGLLEANDWNLRAALEKP